MRFIIILAILISANVYAEAADSAGSSEGAQIFSRYCAGCHGPEGKGKIGPSLQAANNPEQVEGIVRSGKDGMPGFARQLSPEQIKAVAEYVTRKLAGISLEEGNLSRGGVLYRINCSPCHRTDIRGGALLYTSNNAPPLTGLDSATIAGAIRSGPGPMPAFPPSILKDKDVASIVKYVKFMQHPPHPGGLALGYYGPVSEGLVTFVILGLLILTGYWIEAKGRG